MAGKINRQLVIAPNSRYKAWIAEQAKSSSAVSGVLGWRLAARCKGLPLGCQGALRILWGQVARRFLSFWQRVDRRGD